MRSSSGKNSWHISQMLFCFHVPCQKSLGTCSGAVYASLLLSFSISFKAVSLASKEISYKIRPYATALFISYLVIYLCKGGFILKLICIYLCVVL